jgi:hypothetical protein
MRCDVNSDDVIPTATTMLACQGQLLPRPAEQAVVTAPGGYRVRSPLSVWKTIATKR